MRKRDRSRGHLQGMVSDTLLLFLPLQAQATRTATISYVVSQVKVQVNKAFLDSRIRYLRHKEEGFYGGRGGKHLVFQQLFPNENSLSLLNANPLIAPSWG